MAASGIKCVWKHLTPSPDPRHGSPCARSSHGLSFVGGKLLLYGGEHVARTPIEAEAGWILEIIKDNCQWRKLESSTGPPCRVAHSQAVHKNKDVYIFGGRQGIEMGEKPLNDLWKFDITSEKWSQVEAPNPPQERSFHKMVCVDDSLYVFGGCGAQGRLADLHRFDVVEQTWHALGVSMLRGRGGANLISLSSSSLAVVAGFAGEETNDGQVYDLDSHAWKETLMDNLDGLRPRSVSLSCTLPSLGIVVLVGGEVDPSDRGHEGAGCFENDLVVLDASTGGLKETIAASGEAWPAVRGWSDCDADTNLSRLYLFGGLTGNDANPQRLDDLWRCDVSIS